LDIAIQPLSRPLLPGQRGGGVPAGYRRAARVSPAVRAKADFYLHQTQYPIGTQIPDFIEAKNWLFVLEWHKHAPTDNVPEALKQWHRGVSVFESVDD
jgi:hypothetical protein